MSMAQQSDERVLNDEYYRQLRRGLWFGRLPTPLAKVVFGAGRLVEYEPGQVLFLEDSMPAGLFAILGGAVHLETGDDTGRRVPVDIASHGYWFGGISIAAELPPPVAARAFNAVRALFIPAFSLTRLLAERPEFYKALAALAALRLHSFVESLTSTQRPTALTQVAGRLAALGRSTQAGDQSIRAPIIYITQHDLAEMTGHSRQTINFVINQLQEGQLIRSGRRQIQLLDVGKLQSFSATEGKIPL